MHDRDLGRTDFASVASPDKPGAHDCSPLFQSLILWLNLVVFEKFPHREGIADRNRKALAELFHDQGLRRLSVRVPEQKSSQALFEVDEEQVRRVPDRVEHLPHLRHLRGVGPEGKEDQVPSLFGFDQKDQLFKGVQGESRPRPVAAKSKRPETRGRPRATRSFEIP